MSVGEFEEGRGKNVIGKARIAKNSGIGKAWGQEIWGKMEPTKYYLLRALSAVKMKNEMTDFPAFES